MILSKTKPSAFSYQPSANSLQQPDATSVLMAHG
jgi:hypothetical protein